MRRPFRLANILVLGLVLSSLGIQAVTASADPVSKETRKLYLAKCAKCHKLYPPENYSVTEWQDWMLKMKRKSKLKDEAYERLLEYTHRLREVGLEKKKTAH
ncbi:MAG: cytochrome c [Verrucomicrobia bacterium]|nr:MAG: cytochrome c [Verrucomicrobiota bacterium]